MVEQARVTLFDALELREEIGEKIRLLDVNLGQRL